MANSLLKGDSFSDTSGNWALEFATEKYTKQTIHSKDYKLFLNK